MRKIMLGIALAATVALGGCGTTIGSITLPTAAQVQAAAASACGYVGALGDIATLIASFSAAGAIVMTADGIANAICAQVAATPPAASGKFRAALPNKVIVNGVVIHRAP